MNKTLAAVAVLAAVLGPAGGAHAATPDNPGKAYGNCKTNASMGVDPQLGGAGNGYGGHRKGDTCMQPAVDVPHPPVKGGGKEPEVSIPE